MRTNSGRWTKPSPSGVSLSTPASIARAGIYDLALHHDQVLVPCVVRHWKLEEIEGLSAEAVDQVEKRLGPALEHAKRVGVDH